MCPPNLEIGSEQREHGVRESEERYRSFVEQSTEGIWRFELEEPVPTNLAPGEQVERFYRHGYLAECNDAMARMYGYARAQEIVGARLGDLLPSSIPENLQYLKDFVRSGYQLADAESQEVDRYGRTKHFLSDLTGIVENESLLRVWGTQRDITERKHAEEAGARLAAIVESSDDAIISKTLDGVITSWNKGAQKIYGYSPEEVIGKPINILVPPDRPNEIPKILEKLRHGEAIDHFETVRMTKDGGRLDISLTISPIKDSSGNIVGASAIARDITERKRAEETLKRQAHQGTLRADVAAALSSGDAVSDVLRRCAEAMVRRLDVAFARVWTLNEEDVLELQASAGMYTHIDGPHSRVPVGELKIGLIAQERLPHLTNTVTSDPRVSDKEWARREGMVAFAGYPLIVEDRLVGVMAMFARQALAEDTIDALDSVATAIAQGIERKRAEEALRQSELLYRTVMKQATENIFLVDVETRRIAESNPAFREALGYSEEELQRMTLYDIVAADLESIDANIQRVLEQKNTFVGERKYRRKDHSLVDVEVSASTIRRDGRETLCIVAHNVTERKQAEEELRESEERFRETFEQATVGIAHVGTDGRWLRVNQRLCDIVGYEKEEVLGLTFQDITHPDDLETDLEGARRLLAGEIDTYSREKRYFRKDGSIVWIYLTVSLVRSPSDEPRYFISVTEDITERKRAEEAQRFLAEAGTTLSSSLDYRTTLARVARLAVPHLADWCVVDILEEDGSLERLAVAHQDPQKIALVHELQEHYPPDPDAPRGVGQVLSTGSPELVPEIPESLLDGAARDAEHRELLRGLGLKSYMVVPLVARGRTLGAITLVSAESGRRYGQAELELAEELARRAALAVDNARLYRARSEIARTLQGSLLPSRLPEVPGIEVGLGYLPAGEVDVGGDFYDLFDARFSDEAGPSEPSSSWGVVIGDVCGKGAEAAAILALARHTIRAVAIRETRPSAVLSGLNEAMLRQRREHDDYKFCTVTYARLETNEGKAEQGARITVCRGGHSPPLLLKDDGSIYKIGQPGRAIGVFDDANLTEQEVRLAPGDALVLYTDGVVEARSPAGLFFGEERLMALLRSSIALDASTIAGRIESAVLNFQEQTLRDDVAVLVVRVPG